MLLAPLLMMACSPPASAPADAPANSARTASAADEGGYLAEDVRLDPLRLLPGPPVPGTLAEAADRLTDGAAADAAADAAAWSRAASLNGVRTPAFRQALSCALGVVLSEADTPATIRLLRRTNEEMRVLTDAAQTHFRRPRPFGDEPGRSCDPDAATLGPSYPSGQAATGWLWALALSDARPERRAELLGFGAEAGDIRISCRAHWLSDVAGGRLLASALHSQLSALPAYQADVAAARAEAQSAPSLALEACS